MARDQLLGLAADVDRLLAAGAAAVGGSESLRKRGQTLRDLGQKVPAIKPVADAVDRVLQGGPKQANAFLDLVSMTRQLRASLSSAGVEGALTPVEPSGPWETPLHIRDLNPLYGALTESGSGREEVLKDAIGRKAIGDLRLLSPLLDALEDSHAPISNLVTTEALPALGTGVIPEVEARLNLAEGKAGDARRLEVICKLDRARGLELCRKAVREGSIPLRVKALELLPDVSDRDEAEKTGLELCKDTHAEVRVAALLALRDAISDEALNTVLEATRDRSPTARDAAGQTLARLKHAETTPRLLSMLHKALENLDQLKPDKKEKDTKPAKGKKGDAFTKKKNELNAEAVYLLGILGNRKGAGRKEAAQAVMPLLHHQEATIREAAMTSLGGIGAVIDGVIEHFIAGLNDKKPAVATQAATNLSKMEPELREPAMPTVLELLEKPKLEAGLHRALLALLPGHMNKHGGRIMPILRQALASKEIGLQMQATEMLTEIGPAAVELVPDLIRGMGGSGYYNYYFLRYGSCLQKVDPEGTQAIPALVELIGNRKPDIRWRAIHCLQMYGPRAKAAIPEIRRLIDDEKKEGDSHWAEMALRLIEGK